MTQNKKNILRFLLVIAIPTIGVVGVLPWINQSNIYVVGIPLIYAWMFLWFILTSLCLLISWYVFDRDGEE